MVALGGRGGVKNAFSKRRPEEKIEKKSSGSDHQPFFIFLKILKCYAHAADLVFIVFRVSICVCFC